MAEPARTNMTVKGQVTIPRDLRRWAGLEPGRPVEVAAGREAGVIELRVAGDPLTPEQRQAKIDAFLAKLRARGPHPDGLTTDEYMATIREPLPRDPD